MIKDNNLVIGTSNALFDNGSENYWNFRDTESIKKFFHCHHIHHPEKGR
ncbi:hypothetical protein HYD77_00840 [Mycoplasmopsis bovis]|nr:hypothetical protein [Mycoplasmopsis bovis]QQH43515.1 hypothetical protein HYD77_00840 [Mycoplasmopsis bovis]